MQGGGGLVGRRQSVGRLYDEVEIDGEVGSGGAPIGLAGAGFLDRLTASHSTSRTQGTRLGGGRAGSRIMLI